MDRQRASELLPVIQAFAEGKTIHVRMSGGQWVDLHEDPDWRSDEYRIKPEPREFYLYLSDDWVDGRDVYTTAAYLPKTPANAIKVREVLED